MILVGIIYDDGSPGVNWDRWWVEGRKF